MRARPPYLGEAAPVDIEHATLLERLVGLKLSDTNKVNLMIIIDFCDMNTSVMFRQRLIQHTSTVLRTEQYRVRYRYGIPV